MYIWDIWIWIAELMYYWSWLTLEFWLTPDKFYTDAEKWYFKYLISVDRNIIISKDVRKALPNSYKTIKEFFTYPLEDKIKMYEVLKNEDITLDEFKKKFFK